jgi:hypothetical protein
VKRDFDLIRKLVLAVEDGPTGNVTEDLEIDGYTPEQVGYHSYLIVDSGLAEGIDMGAMGDTSPNWQIINLTSAGHDFADTVRSDSTWNKATVIIKDKAGGVTLDLLKQVLIGVVKSGLGL